MNSVLSHEVREAVVSVIHQVFPTANVKFTVPFRGEGVKPICKINNSLHTFLSPRGLRLSAFHHDQKNGGEEENEGKGGNSDVSVAAPAFQSESSSFPSRDAPSLSSHLSHSSRPVLPFITDPPFAHPHPHPSSHTGTSMSVHQQGGEWMKNLGGSVPSFHPFALPSLPSTPLPLPRLVSHLYALSCSSSHLSSPPFCSSRFLPCATCPVCASTSHSKSSMGGSSREQWDVLEGRGSASEGDVLPLPPVVPHVVVRISGYEQVDLNRVIIPRLQKVIPAVREEEGSKEERRTEKGEGGTALREYDSVESNTGISSSGQSSCAPRHPPCRKKKDTNKANFSVKPPSVSLSPHFSAFAPVSHPLDAGGGGAKGGKGTTVTPPPVPSSFSPAVSVWSCRRPPKYSRVHAELCAAQPISPSPSPHRHCPPCFPPSSPLPKDGLSSHVSFRLLTAGQDARKQQYRVGNKRWDTGMEERANRRGSRLHSFLDRETWKDQTVGGLVEGGERDDRISSLAHHYDRRPPHVGSAEEHSGKRVPTHDTFTLYCSKKNKKCGSFSSFLEEKMETSHLCSSIHSIRSWWDWMLRRSLLPSGYSSFCAAESSQSRSTVWKNGKEGVVTLPLATNTTVTSVEMKTYSSSPDSSHFSLPPGGPATISTSSTSHFSSHWPIKSGVMYMSGDLVALALPSSFIYSNRRTKTRPFFPSQEEKKRETMNAHEKNHTRIPRQRSRNIAAFHSLTQRGRNKLVSHVFPHHTPPPKKLNSGDSDCEDHEAESRLSHGNPMTSDPTSCSCSCSGVSIAKSAVGDASLLLSSHGICTPKPYPNKWDNKEKEEINKSYYPLFLSFGNTETSISQLLQRPCSCQREALRGALGVSLPLLFAALPSICLDAVVRIQYWESTRSSTLPNPSAPTLSMHATTSASPTSGPMFLLSSLFHFISIVEDGAALFSPPPPLPPSACCASFTGRVGDLVSEIMAVVEKCSKEPGEEDLPQGAPSRQSKEAFPHNSDNNSPLIPPPPHHNNTLYDSRSALRVALLAAGEWLEARTRPDRAKEGGRSPLMSSSYDPPSRSLPSLDAAVTTILAVGTVKMLLATAPSVVSASQEETPPPTVNLWTMEEISSPQCCTPTPPPPPSSLHSSPSTTGYAFAQSLPPSPSLPFPRWKHNFFLPCEHFAAAEETRLWAERRGEINVLSSNNNNYYNEHEEDVREKNSSIPRCSSSLSSSCSQQGRNQVKEMAEWVSCVECLLQILL